MPGKERCPLYSLFPREGEKVFDGAMKVRCFQHALGYCAVLEKGSLTEKKGIFSGLLGEDLPISGDVQRVPLAWGGGEEKDFELLQVGGSFWVFLFGGGGKRIPEGKGSNPWQGQGENS